MQYGQLAGNTSINLSIYACLAKIHPEDVRKFVKNFRTQPSAQALHTYRELLVGAYLADLGYGARYDRKTEGKTPDWTLLDNTGRVTGIIELMTFHPSASIDHEIGEAIGRGETWVGWMPQNSSRLFQKIQEKAERYMHLADAIEAPYVVAVFGEFTASVDLEELEEVLFSIHGGAFTQFPWLSGMLYFEESAGTYAFRYLSNPLPKRSLDLQASKL